MIEIDQLTQTYSTGPGRVDALAAVSLTVKPGEMTLVRGTSGSGKSTLLLAAGGMRHPTAGRVVIDGKDLYQLGAAPRAAMRGRTLGFVFQTLNLIPYLSALDNVLLAASDNPAAMRDRARGLLSDLGLADRVHHRPGQLSQGERQRAALARAVLNQPKVLLADEPTGNLDPENADIVFHALRRYANEGAAVLVATHATSHLDLADRVYELNHGRLQIPEPQAV